MVSGSSSNSSTKKSTATAASSTSTSNKKPSPLYNKRRKDYEPPTKDSMTPEELSDWRTEQRRKRNKESAAAFRIKTRSRIIQLENEVEGYKRVIEEMRCTMAEMQTRISFLNKTCTSLIESKPYPTTSNDPAMRSGVSSPAFPLMGSIITTHSLPTQTSSSRRQTSESIDERAYLALTSTSRTASDMVDVSTRLNATASAATVVTNKKSISDKPSAVPRTASSATDKEDQGEEDASNSKLSDNDDIDDNDRYLLDLLEKSLGDDMDPDLFI